jgi:hypothetical protein
MRIEESPPILKLIEENKKALIIGDRGISSNTLFIITFSVLANQCICLPR